jgi:hypothetical protein
VSITSDYLTQEELTADEKSFKEISTDLENQNFGAPSLLIMDPLKSGLRAVVGSYSWSSWQNVTITPASKTSVSVITAAILSYIPKIGPITGAMAAVFLEYNLKTGYFTYRVGTALDSNPNYYWEKRQVKLYGDSARTNLLSKKMSLHSNKK